MDAKGFLQKALPWIGAAATGNIGALAGLAVKQISDLTGKTLKTGDQDAISAAVANATPEQLIALKSADNDFAIKMQQIGFEHETDLLRLDDDDRANARAREVTVRDRLPGLLAFAVTVGFFGLLAAMVFKTIPPGSEKIVDIMCGSLGAAWLNVIGYYFGSSAAHDALTKSQSTAMAK